MAYPPPDPEPDDEAPGEAPSRLLCARCKNSPQASTIAWSAEAGTTVHLASVGVTREGFPRVCGGLVVPLEDLHRARFAPGAYALCFPVRHSLSLHVVRLGRRANGRKDTWTGTVLCGKRYRGVTRWLPMEPVRAEAVECEGCREALKGEEP